VVKMGLVGRKEVNQAMLRLERLMCSSPFDTVTFIDNAGHDD
jgi:hypothetical protein